MVEAQKKQINILSVRSLMIEMYYRDTLLSSATGFVVVVNELPYLITNRHNLTGRDQNTNKPLDTRHGGIPDRIRIWHNCQREMGRYWVAHFEKLYTDEDMQNPLWVEHPFFKNNADFAALKLTQLEEVALVPFDLKNTDPTLAICPGDTVSIIGFPFGETAGAKFGIWVSGFVASELVVDYRDLPVFLVDCRSRPGQSGSPVVAFRNGGAYEMTDGSTTLITGNMTRFLGIYSGRIHPDSDIGMVWKATAVLELLSSIK